MDKKKDIIKIRSKRQTGFSTKLASGRQQYLVLTELEEKEPPTIKTMVYLEGMVIDVVKSNPLSKDAYTLHKEIEKQHNKVIEQIKIKKPHLTDNDGI
jgi:hypothetical protein